MFRSLLMAILCLLLGSYWMLVLAVPAVVGDESVEPAAATSIASPDASKEPEDESIAPESKQTNSPAEADAGRTYRLAYKFQPGESVYYEVLDEREIRSRYDEMTEVARNKTESRKHYRVLSVDPDGAAELELVIDWVRMEAKLREDDPGVEFDSANPDLQPQKFQHILKSVGKPQAKMKLAPSGKIVKVLHVAEGTAGASEPQQSFLIVFPESPIAVGHEWKEKFEVRVTVEQNLTQSINLMRVFRLESVEKNLATISMKTAVLTPVQDPLIQAQLMQREIEGRIVFDMDLGKIVSRQVDGDKSVVAPFGPKTAMQAISKYTERMIPATTTARNESETKAAAEKKAE